MGHFLEELPEHLIEWILKQQMFWVASAPLSPDGHVNISPKGIEGTFHVVNSRRVWYEDLSGTGAETVAHIRENGRMTIMFHAFEGPARIVRLYGKGFFYELGTPEYEALISSESRLAGSRAVIGLDILKVGTTCGYAIPYYRFISHRTQLMDWAAKKESIDQEDAIFPPASLSPTIDFIEDHPTVNPKGMKHWWQSRNLNSLDGLPAFSRQFGLAFPFVFSFGRLRATENPAAQSKTRRLKGASRLPDKSLQLDGVQPPLGEVIFDDNPAHDHMQHERVVSVAFHLLPFLLTFVIGVIFGRVYGHYHLLSEIPIFVDRL